ncbi:MAG: hypothetical protein HQL29_03820 [Candidatus Omnitrophica bacterium]|nr:hypothetical protein [Candidatus Omnitrophota bacterium]
MEEEKKQEVEETMGTNPEAENVSADDKAVTDETAIKKNSAITKKNTKNVIPEECGSCGKSFPKKMWYYRDNAHYCNKKCYKKKMAELVKEK